MNQHVQSFIWFHYWQSMNSRLFYLTSKFTNRVNRSKTIYVRRRYLHARIKLNIFHKHYILHIVPTYYISRTLTVYYNTCERTLIIIVTLHIMQLLKSYNIVMGMERNIGRDVVFFQKSSIDFEFFF